MKTNPLLGASVPDRRLKPAAAVTDWMLSFLLSTS